MIPIERLIYKIDYKLNKLASNRHQEIPIEDKLLALNEARIRLLKKKVNQNNLYRLGLDAFKSRYQDLQSLITDYEEVNIQKTTQVLTSYDFKVKDLKNKYHLPIDIVVLAKKGKCENHKVYVKRIVKHGDLTTQLNNPHYSPSFSYQEALATMSEDNVTIYTGDDFEITKAYFSYIRYPIEMDFEGYVRMDGTDSQTVDCDFPEYLEDELLELAIIELGFNTENLNAAQAAQQKNVE